MKSLLRTLVLPVAALPLVACGFGGADDGPVTITVETVGWSEGSTSDPTTSEVEATKGGEVTVSGRTDEVTVTFTSVAPERVELETDTKMAPEGKTGGINLNDTRSDFALEPGTPLRFSTPTTDGGTTWVMTIKDSASPSS